MADGNLEEQKAYLIGLASAPGIGPKKTEVLLKFFKTPKEVWTSSERDLKEILGKKDFSEFLEYREKTDVISIYSSLSDQGIEVITILEDTYPKLLRQIPSAPPVLYYKGDLLSTTSRPCIAVVGTRLITMYGKEVTEHLVEGLVASGLTIVSGLAHGVDTVAHQTAIASGGKTIAVLGGGFNFLYPPANKTLAAKIASGFGAVITEYPPEEPALPQNFPARNRIISGLSLGVIVTEAAEDSGSLITADFASQQNREVFAVPGPITSKLSKGPSKLLKVGAKLVSGVEDILEELKIEARGNNLEFRDYKGENEVEKKILALLENESRDVDSLVRETGLSTSQVSSTLTLLEIKGVLRNLGTGVYSRK